MTSDEAFHELSNLIKNYPEKAEVGVPATDEVIRTAQDFLQISFPDSYTKFLKNWGTLSVGPFEFYGIAGTEFEHGRIPNGVWFTFAKRKQLGLPKELIVLIDNDGDQYHCVEIPSGRIVVWDVSQKRTTGQKAEDVFNFILNEGREWFM
jgi:hypothetical protein